MPPTVTSPSDHSHSDRPLTATISPPLRVISVTIMFAIQPAKSRYDRIWRAKPSRANRSSRSAWANSFTDWMLV